MALLLCGAPAAAAQRPEVGDLAKERGISLAAAARRLGWQQRAPRLAERARGELGARFGGVWIDPADGDRVKLGVAGGGAPARARALEAAAAVGLEGAVDIVSVEHRASLLRAASAWLADRLAEVNRGAAWPLVAGIRTDENVVQLELPRDGDITAEQRAVVDRARERYGDALRLAFYAGKPRRRACNYPYCDPPLRGGIAIHGGGTSCTGGFLARGRSDGRLYQLTAGHCREGNVNWGTFFTNGVFHVIGPFQSSVWGTSGDAGILRVNNPAGWNARAWVLVTLGRGTTPNEAYRIVRDGGSVVGMRICTTGAFWGRSDCGNVTQLGVTATYGDPFGQVRTVTGLGRGNFCGTGGDSGSPMYASNTAFGLQVAGFLPCDSLYQGIRGAENLVNVNVSFDGAF
jgi:hypothetical protein